VVATVYLFDMIGVIIGPHTRDKCWKMDAKLKEDEGPKVEGDVVGRQSDVVKTAELSTEVT